MEVHLYTKDLNRTKSSVLFREVSRLWEFHCILQHWQVKLKDMQ